MTPTTPEQGFTQAIADRDNIIRGLLGESEAITKERDALQDQITELTSEEHSIPELRSQLQEAFAEKQKCYFAVSQQALAITNLVKERDALEVRIGALIVERSDAFFKVIKERDALAASRYAYASEFGSDEEGQPDVGSIHQNIRALKAAAKLALDALETAQNTLGSSHAAFGSYEAAWDKYADAIAALKKAGVQ